MPGLPFGAAQQHSVPAEALDYEGIVSIEFIEVDPDLPYPRSVAYRPVEGGAQMRIRDFAPEIEDFDLSVEEARAFIAGLVTVGLFAWQRVYRPAQGTFVNVGNEWRLEVRFAKTAGVRKRPKPFRAEGENVFPDNFDDAVHALMLGHGEGQVEESSSN